MPEKILRPEHKHKKTLRNLLVKWKARYVINIHSKKKRKPLAHSFSFLKKAKPNKKNPQTQKKPKPEITTLHANVFVQKF